MYRGNAFTTRTIFTFLLVDLAQPPNDVTIASTWHFTVPGTTTTASSPSSFHLPFLSLSLSRSLARIPFLECIHARAHVPVHLFIHFNLCLFRRMVSLYGRRPLSPPVNRDTPLFKEATRKRGSEKTMYFWVLKRSLRITRTRFTFDYPSRHASALWRAGVSSIKVSFDQNIDMVQRIIWNRYFKYFHTFD